MLKKNKLVYYILSSIFFISCGSKKDVVYFQDAMDFETLVGENGNSYTSRFKVDDVVSIYVSTLNPEASAPFNLTVGVDSGNGTVSQQVDYIIDKDGNIDFPVIGKIKVEGLSPEELRLLLTNKLSDYLKDPIINIRLRNFSVTVLGEVNRPGTYPVVGEQITILEALGLAGDLTIKGERKNILVIRDLGGTKVYNRVDITSKDIVNSPAFYLTQNDVVYIEPNKSAAASSSLDNRTTIAMSIVSLLITTSVILITRN